MSAFDVQNFINTNKKLLIWTAFFILLYLVREFFGLLFITFILCFIFSNLIERLSGWTRLPRRLWTVVIYLVFVSLVITVLALVGPKVGEETTIFLKQLPETVDNFHDHLNKVASQQPSLAPIMDRLREAVSIKGISGMNRETLVPLVLGSVNRVTHYFSIFLLGILFSFFILLDLPNLKRRTLDLENTRFRSIYQATATSVARFALVVGAAFQAQIAIALINTALTAGGLLGLGIHPIVLLSTIVFFCGLIPVLGVFISSVPIILLAFNAGGPKRALAALIMIIIVHMVETYILNPRIVSAVMKINPVLTLMILYLGHSLFGLWGVLLGVPVTVYVYRYVILGGNGTLEDGHLLD